MKASKNRNAFLNTVMRRALVAGTLLALAASASRADVNVYRQTLKSTTWVLAKNSDGTSSGAGVFIDVDKKLVVTNAHVVGDSRNTVVFFPERFFRNAIGLSGCWAKAAWVKSTALTI